LQDDTDCSNIQKAATPPETEALRKEELPNIRGVARADQRCCFQDDSDSKCGVGAESLANVCNQGCDERHLTDGEASNERVGRLCGARESVRLDVFGKVYTESLDRQVSYQVIVDFLPANTYAVDSPSIGCYEQHANDAYPTIASVWCAVWY